MFLPAEASPHPTVAYGIRMLIFMILYPTIFFPETQVAN